MTPPVFALYVTCLLLGRVALERSSSLRFVSVNAGGEVTLECFYGHPAAVRFYWYKQTLGAKPKLVSSLYKHKNGTLTDDFKNKRFHLETTTGKYHLKISDVIRSDSATYHCIGGYLSIYEFLESIVVSVKDSGLDIQTRVHLSAPEAILPGVSVTLSCTVQTGTCDEKHSVYWFKKFDESSRGLIYTTEGRNDQCESKPETHTLSCVYDLTIENLNLSDAGTYYCAVSSCGHILFGNGTKLEFKDKVGHGILVYCLIAAVVFNTILVVSLAYAAYGIYKTNSHQSTDPQARSTDATSASNTEGHQDEDSLHYSVLKENRVGRSRRQRIDTKSECVYSSVK